MTLNQRTQCDPGLRVQPTDATHFLPANQTDFRPGPTFMKRGPDFTGPESGTVFYCWFHWYQGSWHRDHGFSDRHNRLKPIAELPPGGTV
jgi:hypothetical protein